MGTFGELLLAKVKEKVQEEQKNWEVKKVRNGLWAAASPSGEVFSFTAEDDSAAQTFIKNKIMKEKYGTAFSRDRMDTNQAGV